MTLPELAAANLPLVLAAAVLIGMLLGYWARGVHNRAGLAVVEERDGDYHHWRVYLRRAAVGPLRARREAAQADAERLEGEL